MCACGDQVADGKDVTAYQLIASREELSYLKLATDARGLQPIFNTTAKDLVTYLLPSNDVGVAKRCIACAA
eukprot:scaffold9738_cov18-Tisochrysis_lutea.AAC.1